jgi:hypothetical protein
MKQKFCKKKRSVGVCSNRNQLFGSLFHKKALLQLNYKFENNLINKKNRTFHIKIC